MGGLQRQRDPRGRIREVKIDNERIKRAFDKFKVPEIEKE